jgi:hypothetical protein
MGAATPDEWARSKRDRLERRATGEARGHLDAAREVVMPGVPAAAVLGFAANGGTNENTTGWLAGDDVERATALRVGRKPLGGDPREGYGRVGSDDLHELGPFGVEGGHCPDLVATGDCPWVVVGRGDDVRKILGRAGVTGARWHGAVADQYAIGVANLARHSDAARAKLHALDPRLAWDPDGKVWDLWRWANTMGAWSAGAGGMMRHVARYAAELAALAPAARWGAFCRRAAEVDDRGAKHRADEYSALRTSQKIAAGRLAVQWTGEGASALAWLDDGLGADRDAVMARLAAVSS